MKVGVLGAGSAGRRHAANAIALHHEVAFYDPQPLPVMSHTHGAFTSRRELLDWADAVVVASPSEHHLDDLLGALAQKRPVLVEKPIALLRQRKAVQDLVELNRGAKTPIPVAVGYNLRFHPLIQELRTMLMAERAKGREPRYACFQCCQYTDSADALTVGCLEAWATHEIDLAEHLIGDLRLIDHHVSRFQVDLGLQRWDQSKPECQVHIHSDMIAHQRIRQLLICTERLSQRLDLERYPVNNEHYKAELAAFLDWAKNGIKHTSLATGEDGVRALQIAERAMI